MITPVTSEVNPETLPGGRPAQSLPGPPSRNLLGMTRPELEQLALDAGQPRYRGGQIYEGLYQRRVRDFAGLTNLSQEFRRRLGSTARIAYPRIEREFQSRDGSVRYLLGLDDGDTIEAVYMPEEN
ncbi:MAG TPA: hypothetical protein VKU44_06915, partial [Terriglobia bacterium]|nr:hypothetical protein [Terriglobia bacterium]